MPLEAVHFTLTGVTGLIVHNEQLASPLNAHTKSVAEIASKRKKTDADHGQLAWREYLGGFYWDAPLLPDGNESRPGGIGPYVPGANIFTCFIEGARLTKAGTQVEKALFGLEDLKVPIEYDGPREPLKMFDGGLLYQRLVKVSARKVLRTRPMFPEWSLDFDAMFEIDVINADVLEAAAVNAGKFIGLCDGRRKLGFGRFEVEMKATTRNKKSALVSKRAV
jgi:hypothetical protein